MNTQNAFQRSKMMFAAISAIIATGAHGFGLQSAIHGLGEYKSRGHGGKHKAHGKHIKCLNKMYRQKNKPHQGLQEIARRVARMPTTISKGE